MYQVITLGTEVISWLSKKNLETVYRIDKEKFVENDLLIKCSLCKVDLI
jgi:hypothetical protein